MEIGVDSLARDKFNGSPPPASPYPLSPKIYAFLTRTPQNRHPKR